MRAWRALVPGCFAALAQGALRRPSTDPLLVYPHPDVQPWVTPHHYPKATFPHPYKVSVRSASGEGESYDAFTYFTAPLATALVGKQATLGKNVTWTTVSFDGGVLKKGIEVTVYSSLRPAKSCVVRPYHFGIDCEILNSTTFRFVIPQPMMKVSLELDPPSPGNFDRALDVVPAALLIFADPLEEELPETSQQGLLQYGPGVHDVGCVTVPPHTIVHVAGGAYVRGSFQTLPGSDNVTIRGRGVITIDGEQSRCCDHGIITYCGGMDLRVEGVAVVASYQHSCHIQANAYYQHRADAKGVSRSCNVDPDPGRGPTITNVKVIGWQYSGTGIVPGRRAHVSHSFIRVNDDCHPDCQSHQLWESNTLWQLDNGWPFQVQWNTNDHFEEELKGGAQNVTVRDTTVVHVEQVDNGAYRSETSGIARRSIFGAWQEVPNTKKDLRFENIRVEGGVWTALFMLYVGNGPFTWGGSSKDNPWKCCGNGNLENISFDNVIFSAPSNAGNGGSRSTIKGNHTAGGGVHNVAFRGVVVHSKAITDASQIPMDVDPKSTSGITFA